MVVWHSTCDDVLSSRAILKPLPLTPFQNSQDTNFPYVCKLKGGIALSLQPPVDDNFAQHFSNPIPMRAFKIKNTVTNC